MSLIPELRLRRVPRDAAALRALFLVPCEESLRMP